MTLATNGTATKWDDVMREIGRWLVNHLDDTQLALWLTEQQGPMHPALIDLVEQRLAFIERLERENNTEELARLREAGIHAIPRRPMRCLWQLMLAGRVKFTAKPTDFYRWWERLDRNGPTAAVRFGLREALAPMLTIRARPPSPGTDADDAPSENLGDLFDLDVEPAADELRAVLAVLQTRDSWARALPRFVEEFEHLLHDALDLFSELGVADFHHDRSWLAMPSISPHWQNHEFRHWTMWIELLRDSWVALYEGNRVEANKVAYRWFDLPYPTFKRLALFAASYDDIANVDWVEWLSTDTAHWLWSMETRRETMRLLASRAPSLSVEARRRLEHKITVGPQADTEAARDHTETVEQSVWLRLAKLNSSGAALGKTAQLKLAHLSQRHPEWMLAEDERDEFAYWSNVTIVHGEAAQVSSDRVPRLHSELLSWLMQKSRPRETDSPAWREACRRHFIRNAFALKVLAEQNAWPIEHWREALQAWSEDRHLARSQVLLTFVAETMPDDVIEPLLHALSWWVEKLSEKIATDTPALTDLCRRMLKMDHEDLRTEHVLMQAINHPVGRVAQALLNLWLRRSPSDGDGLPADLESIFAQISTNNASSLRAGRVVLASRAVAFYRVDREWTERHLLPKFDWNRDRGEAIAAWSGFLWSPRLYLPLFLDLKSDLLATANHHKQLKDAAGPYLRLLTRIAAEQPDIASIPEYRAAFEVLDASELSDCLQFLVEALNSAAEHHAAYWANRVRPFWEKIWPKSVELVTENIAEKLVILSIAARSCFPDAVSAFSGWLIPVRNLHRVLFLLTKSELCAQFPERALDLLATIVGRDSQSTRDLLTCLDSVAASKPGLAQSTDYRRLLEYAQRNRLIATIN